MKENPIIRALNRHYFILTAFTFIYFYCRNLFNEGDLAASCKWHDICRIAT